MNTLASALTGIDGERVALTDVSVSSVLRDLLAEVTVSQTYRNDEPINIEAVYTFPLPLDATLLELQVEIGGRVLKGVVVEKKAAEEKYEDAIAGGDTAVMLQVLEPGLYTMNVGNLQPKEQAKIIFSYAILYRWTGDQLRFFLPTTVAPRYGESDHQPHQVPQSSLTVENQFSLRVEIYGALREAQFRCPSHEVDLAKSEDKIVITLQQAKVVMDRDFILSVKAPQATRSFALCGADGDGVAAIASFQPFFPGLQQPRPLNLAIVIDCSGSMQGDSIDQAKQALDGILDGLLPQDHITMIAFGNTTNRLFDRLLPCNKTNISKAKRFAKQLSANMGGTEIGKALNDTYSAISTESADIFLVTDGEVSAWESVVQGAKRSGHRIFTVGVGSAVSEAFVRRLAAETGGECELVSPREGMADRVIRHYERMRAPRASRVEIHWPKGAIGIAPTKLGAVFEGDTLIACAHFDQSSISGSVVLEIETEKGEVMHHELPLSMPPITEKPDRLSTIARLAASTRMKEFDHPAGLAIALHYRLVSPWTNWLVIDERSDKEKAEDLPILRKVPQTMAAGSHGLGTVHACMSVADLPGASAMFISRVPDFVVGIDFDASMEMPSIRPEPKQYIPEPFRRLIDLIENKPTRLELRGAIDLLQEAGLGSDCEDLFRHATGLGLNADMIAVIVLAELLGGRLGEFLSTELESTVKSLQERAQLAKKDMQELGRLGIALARTVDGSLAHEVLRPQHAQEIREMLERFGNFRDLFDHLQECTRRSAEKFKHQFDRRHHQQREII